METRFKEVFDYCADNIERLEKRISRAFCRHIERGIPIYLANEGLTLEIQDSIDEWCDLEEVDSDQIDIEEFMEWVIDNIA